MKMALDLDDLAGKIGEFKQSTDVRTRGGGYSHTLPIRVCAAQRGVVPSGRQNVLRKLLRIPYRRLMASFAVC